MSKNNDKIPGRYTAIYLVDPVMGDYEELSVKNMRKRLNKSDNFIYNRCLTLEPFIFEGRLYYLTDDFGTVWELL